MKKFVVIHAVTLSGFHRRYVVKDFQSEAAGDRFADRMHAKEHSGVYFTLTTEEAAKNGITNGGVK